MKKRVTSVLVAVMLSLAAILSLTGCSSITQKIKEGGSGSSKEGGTQSAAEILQEEPLVTEAEEDGKYHIGILTYRRHGASEETVEGFEEEMRSLLGSEKVVFEEVDADGDAQKCAEIATGFANSGYQLIFACGTEAVQNAGAAVNNIPIIGGCVSDYLLSSVVSSLDAPGGNITGVSSLGPIQEQMDLIERITPWPASVAIVSSGTETGSRFEAEVATQILDEKGISWKSFHAATEEDLRLQMKEAAENYSCIYLPTMFGRPLAFEINGVNSWVPFYPFNLTIYIVQMLYVLILLFFTIKSFRGKDRAASLILLSLFTVSVITAILEYTSTYIGSTNTVTALGVLVYYVYLSTIYQHDMRETITKKELEIAQNELTIRDILPRLRFA